MSTTIHQYNQYGEMLKEAIDHNLRRFWGIITRQHGKKMKPVLLNAAIARRGGLGENALTFIGGMSRGAGVPFEELLTFNLFGEVFDPEGCSVMVALADATEDGRTIFFKQSDKRGEKDFAGDPAKFYQQKEINVIMVEQGEKNKVIGVTAAGSNVIKMGLSDKGVALGSNLARIKKLKDEKTGYFAAGGRGEYMRQGLFKGNSAEEAAHVVLPQLLSNPVASPGNIEFADAKLAVALECSFTELAAEWCKTGIMARANRFEVMRHLNREDDNSSRLRYERAMRFLEEHRGKITVERMMEIAVDHENGPGPNSICRHSDDWEEETSQSSAIMKIDPKEPKKSEIYIALGKPCHAWSTKEGEGWIKLNMEATEADIPEKFLTGGTFKKYYLEKTSKNIRKR